MSEQPTANSNSPVLLYGPNGNIISSTNPLAVSPAYTDFKSKLQRSISTENGSPYQIPFEVAQKPWQMIYERSGTGSSKFENAAVAEYRYVITYIFVSLIVVTALAALAENTFIIKEGVKEIFKFGGSTNGTAVGSYAILAQLSANPVNVAELTNQKFEVEGTTVGEVRMRAFLGGYMIKG